MLKHVLEKSRNWNAESRVTARFRSDPSLSERAMFPTAHSNPVAKKKKSMAMVTRFHHWAR